MIFSSEKEETAVQNLLQLYPECSTKNISGVSGWELDDKINRKNSKKSDQKDTELNHQTSLLEEYSKNIPIKISKTTQVTSLPFSQKSMRHLFIKINESKKLPHFYSIPNYKSLKNISDFFNAPYFYHKLKSQAKQNIYQNKSRIHLDKFKNSEIINSINVYRKKLLNLKNITMTPVNSSNNLNSVNLHPPKRVLKKCNYNHRFNIELRELNNICSGKIVLQKDSTKKFFSYIIKKSSEKCKNKIHNMLLLNKF